MIGKGLGRRYVLLLLSIFVNAFGIAFITKAGLGTSPISSVPYVLSLASPPSFGLYTFILNILFVIIEAALMGKAELRRKWFEIVVQLPILVIFSASIDVSMHLLQGLVPSTYVQMLFCLVVGCLILAAGIGWAVKANVAMNPGEYLVNVICGRLGKPFGNVKLCFDATLVVIALILSLVLMGNVSGLREGTIVAAMLVGPFERMLYPLWKIFDRVIG